MAQQAIITLTAITPGIVPPKRVLKLNPECQTVPVGRASKSVSKGLLSAEDNAWFDNPVMSRDHAELILKQEDMSIVIKDVHSMHGTQVNDEKLPPNATQVVMVGDVLSFGAEVRRGPEVFPPCKFRIDYVFMPWIRGFQFPDSSDIEDEQDHSEEEVQVEESQEEDMTPVETPPRKQSTSIDAIDLTSDDSEPAEPSSGPQGLSAEEIAADKHAMGQSAAPIVIQGDSEEEDENDSEVENQQLEYADSEEDSEDDSDKENNEESDDSHDDDADACGNDWENSEILDTESNLDTSQVSDIAPMSARMFHDNKDIPVSSIRSTAGGSTEDHFHGDIHFGKSANTAAWEDALSEENDDDESSQDEDIEDRLPSDTRTRALPPLGQSFPKINTDVTPTTGSYVWPTMAASASSHALLPQAVSPIRQPSPSDAAMAKSQTVNPVQIHHLPGNQFSNFMAHTLGEKSGKKDFFEAWEINRARLNDEESRHAEYSFMGDGIARPKFNQLGHPYNPRPSAPAPMQNTSPQQAQYLQRQQLLSQQISRENAFAQSRNFPQHMAFTQLQQRMAQAQAQALQQQQQQALNAQKMMTEQSAFKLGSPPASMPMSNTFSNLRQQPAIDPEVQSPTFVLRAPSPELDMTSAVKFNESKAAIAAVQPGRSAVRINDIVEPLATESDAKSLKRKASDISDVLEEEVHVWASKDSSVSRAEVINSSDVEVQTENTSQQQEDSGSTEALSPSDSADQAPVEPAHKRIKKFAEVVGYTALGGLAGGVALFSALVATAPDFL